MERDQRTFLSKFETIRIYFHMLNNAYHCDFWIFIAILYFRPILEPFIVDEVCPYDANQSCTDPACSTSRSKAQHSYIPLKQMPLVPYSWRTHLTGFAILVGVTIVAVISLKVIFSKSDEVELSGKLIGIWIWKHFVLCPSHFHTIFSNKRVMV